MVLFELVVMILDPFEFVANVFGHNTSSCFSSNRYVDMGCPNSWSFVGFRAEEPDSLSLNFTRFRKLKKYSQILKNKRHKLVLYAKVERFHSNH